MSCLHMKHVAVSRYDLSADLTMNSIILYAPITSVKVTILQ